MSHNNQKKDSNTIVAETLATNPEAKAVVDEAIAHLNEVVAEAQAEQAAEQPVVETAAEGAATETPAEGEAPAPQAEGAATESDQGVVKTRWFAWAKMEGKDYASHEDQPTEYPGADISKSGIVTPTGGISGELNPFSLNICRAVANTGGTLTFKVYEFEGKDDREQGESVLDTDKLIFEATCKLIVGTPTDPNAKTLPEHNGLVWNVAWTAGEKTGNENVARCETLIEVAAVEAKDGKPARAAYKKVGQDKDNQNILRHCLALTRTQTAAWPKGVVERTGRTSPKVAALKAQNETLAAKLAAQEAQLAALMAALAEKGIDLANFGVNAAPAAAPAK